MRELVLKRIEEIKHSFGSDQFGKRYEKGKKKGQLLPSYRWSLDQDFSILTDEALIKEFEMIVMSSYKQR